MFACSTLCSLLVLCLAQVATAQFFCFPGQQKCGMNCCSCPIGTFNNLLGSGTCQQCPVNTYVATTLASNCIPCPEHSGHAFLGQKSADACKCNTGYEGPLGGPCTVAAPITQPAIVTSCPNLCRAPAGYAVTSSGANLEPCSANHYNNGSAKACTACPWPQTFTTATGLTDVQQCACRPGYERLATGVCTACALGSFKESSGDAACASCAAVLGTHSTTPQPAAANASACVCKPGFALVNGACTLTTCPPGASLVITESFAACSCSPGFAHLENLHNGSVVCTACADGHFKDNVANAACTSCGLNTVSAAPRANRTACACAPDYEPGALDGPDVLGGSCVASCPPGFTGSHGNCAKCTTGKFKPSKGKACLDCPGARSASPVGNVFASKCSCPQSTMEIAAADMVVVERLGPLVDTSAESLAGDDALLVDANENRHLWRIEILFPSVGARSALVTVGGRIVFACARNACHDTTLMLQGMRGLLNASSLSSSQGHTRFSVSWRTRRQVVLAASSAAAKWFQHAAAQAEAWAAAGRLRAGAAVFRTRHVYSANVTACAPCPKGLLCAAHVPG